MAPTLCALALGACAACAAACPFGGAGPLPKGHPRVPGRALGNGGEYPGWIEDETADDTGSLSYAAPWSPVPRWNDFLDFLTQKSSELGDADLCYWSMQTLPGPGMRTNSPSVSIEDVNLWFENTGGEANNFADLAVKRMQSLVTQDGPVMWTGCSVGRTLRRAMCDAGRELSPTVGARLVDCGTHAVYNQTLMVPVAIVMFNFSSSSVTELMSTLHSWRTGEAGHAPQMTSALVHERGWGPGGQIISKTVPCWQIPEKFRYQNLGDCDQMGDSSLLADEAFEVWSSLCSVTKSDCSASLPSHKGASTGRLATLPSVAVVALAASLM